MLELTLFAYIKIILAFRVVADIAGDNNFLSNIILDLILNLVFFLIVTGITFIERQFIRILVASIGQFNDRWLPFDFVNAPQSTTCRKGFSLQSLLDKHLLETYH